MNKDELVIATLSLVRSEAEETLLKAALSQLSSLNVPVFVTDGGSPPPFIRFLHRLPNFTVLHATAKGVFAQARSSLTEAAKTGKPFIFYTEPDKENFFKTGLTDVIKAVEAESNLGIVMASRNKEGFATFPAFQQMTETAISHCCGEVVGVRADYCYGPFLLRKELVEHLSGVQEDIGWGWRPFVFNKAHRLGYKVAAFEGPFLCPEAQRKDDAAERIYRMKQLEQNIRGLVMSNA